jgi:4a-hydroxytetrahydrobiopterin dehydratase
MTPAQENTTNLSGKKCTPCHGGTPALSAERANRLLAGLPGWQSNGKEISRTFSFKNYYETMALVNAIAYIAHREDHHPDLEVGYNKCVVRYSTHAVGGLSENDFICAAKVNKLAGET